MRAWHMSEQKGGWRHEHIRKHFPPIFHDYCVYAGISKREMNRTLKAVCEWKLDEVDDWFAIYDALGLHEGRDEILEDFFQLARLIDLHG